MGKTCAIPRCTTGRKVRLELITNEKYKSKLSSKRRSKDIFAFEKWKQVAASDNFPLSDKNHMCEKHFRELDLSRKFTNIVNDGVLDKIERETPLLHKGAVPCFFMNQKSNITTERTLVSPEPAVMIPAPESDGNIGEAEIDNIVKWDFDGLGGAGAQMRFSSPSGIGKYAAPQLGSSYPSGIVNFDGAQMRSSYPSGIGKYAAPQLGSPYPSGIVNFDGAQMRSSYPSGIGKYAVAQMRSPPQDGIGKCA